MVLILAFVAMFFPWLAQRDFATRGEAREALVAQDISLHGNWVLPQGYAGAVPSKPPLLHWSAAALAKLNGGMSEMALRLPGALASLVFILCYYVFLQSRLGPRTALYAAFVLLSSVEWFRAALSGRVDMLLSACVCGGLLWLYRWYERGLVGIPWLGIVLLAAGTLSKGPVAVVLPAVVFGLFLLIQSRGFWRSAIAVLKVFVPALSIASLWYLLAYLERPHDFGEKIFYENVARFLSSQADEPHTHSVFYLLLTLILGCLPWSLFVAAMLKWPLGLKKYLRRSSLEALSPLARYGLLTVIVFFVFFSIPSGKRSVYLLPIYPVLAAWIGLLLDRALGANSPRLGFAFRALGGLVLLCYVGVAYLFLERLRVTSLLNVIAPKLAAESGFYLALFAEEIWALNLLELTVLLAPFCLSLALAMKATTHSSVVNLGIGLVVSLCVMGHGVFYAKANNAVSGREFAAQIESIVARDSQIYSFGAEFYGLSYYSGRRFERFEEHPQAQGYIVLYRHDLERFRLALPEDSALVTLVRSVHGIVKPLEDALLVKLERRSYENVSL